MNRVMHSAFYQNILSIIFMINCFLALAKEQEDASVAAAS